MNKVLLLSLILSVSPAALAQDTTTNTTTTDTTTAPLDPNGDGIVDTNNNGRADTREFPWGLVGLVGLAGLAGLNHRTATPVHVETRDTTRR